MDYGYLYTATPLADITVGRVEGAVLDYLPEKIAIISWDDVKDAIPELIAFWTYLKRQYHLPQSDAVLASLKEIEPEFKQIMNGKSRRGMAKGFFM